MLDNHHLHIDEDDIVGKWLADAIGMAKSGSIHITAGDSEALSITAGNGTVKVDILDPSYFRIDDDTSIWDKLRTATELAGKLSDSETTVAFFRKGKEVIRLGRTARPTLSKVITRSNDIQLSSIREFSKLRKDLRSD